MPFFSVTISCPSTGSTFSPALCCSSNFAAPSAPPGDGDAQNDLRAHLLHQFVNVGVHYQLPLLDDADLVADVGQLGQDVAGDHDRLAHRAAAP